MSGMIIGNIREIGNGGGLEDLDAHIPQLKEPIGIVALPSATMVDMSTSLGIIDKLILNKQHYQPYQPSLVKCNPRSHYFR